MKKHKNMAKKNMKLNEEGVGDFKDIPGFQRKTTQVTDPVGYLICSKKMLDYVKRKGFNPNLSGNGIIGKGLYFIESNLYPNLDSFRRYGDSAIKVRANGTFNAYQSNYFGGNVFLVPPEQFDSIEILDMIEPGKIQQQKDDMYANYGNRSIGGGAKDMDDFYDLNIPGSLSMQAMEEPDDYVGSLYRDNGQNPRWASPKGDFTTKRISESQLHKMVAESIKKALNGAIGRKGGFADSENVISEFADLILSVNDENTANSLAREIYMSYGNGGAGLEPLKGFLRQFESNPNKAAQINNTDF